jgi:hypothetical protein
LDKQGADVSKLHSLFIKTDGEDDFLALDRHMDHLDNWLKYHPKVIAVGIDPLAAFMGDVKTNSNSDVRKILGRMAKVACRHRTAIIAIDHLAKSVGMGKGSAMLSNIGSIAFSAAPRSCWQVWENGEEGGSILVPVKTSNGKATGWAFHIDDDGLAWDDVVTQTADEVAFAAQNEAPGVRDEIKEWLLDLLKHGAKQARVVKEKAKQEGFCDRTLRYAQQELGIKPKKMGGTGGCWMWELPKKVKGGVS